MREIKFRGKRIDNGEWVKGHLWLHSHRGVGQLVIGTGTRSSSMDGFEVDPDTLGQFTGFAANGNANTDEIYEGSLIINYSRNGGKPHPVVWSYTHGGWVGKYGDLEYAISYELDEIEVVGSIHDNPSR